VRRRLVATAFGCTRSTRVVTNPFPLILRVISWCGWFVAVLVFAFVVLQADEQSQLANAVMAAGAVLAVWIVAFSGLFAWQSSNLQLFFQLHLRIGSRDGAEVFRRIAEMRQAECKEIESGTWKLRHCVGFSYLRTVNPEDPLHSERRQLTWAFDGLCALFVQGMVPKRVALSLFRNLHEWAAILTVLEEVLALRFTCERYTNEQRAQLVREWNRSRRRLWPRRVGRVEPGKPNMRALSGMRLLLVEAGPSCCDYGGRIFRAKVDEILESGGGSTTLRLRLLAGAAQDGEGASRRQGSRGT
jgi:hypothetical protein